MILCRVLGSTVATRKDARLEGTKLLVVAETDPDGAEREELHVAADAINPAHRAKLTMPAAVRPMVLMPPSQQSPAVVTRPRPQRRRRARHRTRTRPPR